MEGNIDYRNVKSKTTLFFQNFQNSLTKFISSQFSVCCRLFYLMYEISLQLLVTSFFVHSVAVRLSYHCMVMDVLSLSILQNIYN